MGCSRLPWMCRGVQPRAGCPPGREPRRRVLSLPRTVALRRERSLDSSARSHQPHCKLAGLRSPVNRCPPPQPSPCPSKTGFTKLIPEWQETPAVKVCAVLVASGLEASHKPTPILLHSAICRHHEAKPHTVSSEAPVEIPSFACQNIYFL